MGRGRKIGKNGPSRYYKHIKDTNRKLLGVAIDLALSEELKELAQKHNRSVSGQAAFILKEYLDEN